MEDASTVIPIAGLFVTLGSLLALFLRGAVTRFFAEYDENKAEREKVQKRLDELEKKDAEREEALATIRAEHADTLARMERETQARLQAEAAAKAAAEERDTARLEKTQLEARYRKAQGELEKRVSDLEQDRSEREARYQAELKAERERRETAERELADMRQQTEQLTIQVSELRAEVDRLRKVGTGPLTPADNPPKEGGSDEPA